MTTNGYTPIHNTSSDPSRTVALGHSSSRSCGFSVSRTILSSSIGLYVLSTTVWILWFCINQTQFGYPINKFDTTVIQNAPPTCIYMITPTHDYLEQKADLTRLSQTLRLVTNLHWIVVEDSNKKSSVIEKLLNRSGLSYTHLNVIKDPKFLGRGSTQRNLGIKWLQDHFSNITRPVSGVVYFGDDDNTYDTRLFELMRNIKGIGVWAVGLVGGVTVEAPKINSNGTVIGWDVSFAENRKFATDMAGFAINLNLILNHTAYFKSSGVTWGHQETAFLEQFHLKMSQLETIGLQKLNSTYFKREVLVWHTKTKSSGGRARNDRGFEV